MAIAKQLLIDARQCDSPLLSDLNGLEALFIEAIEASGADVVGQVNKHYRKTRAGATLGVLIGLGDSHATLHTFPEKGAWLADIVLTGRNKPAETLAILRTRLGGVIGVIRIERG